MRVQAGREEQEDHAELAERLEELGLVHEAEQRRAEDRAREELPDDRRLLDGLEHPAEQPRAGERQEDLQQVLVVSSMTGPEYIVRAYDPVSVTCCSPEVAGRRERQAGLDPLPLP